MPPSTKRRTRRKDVGLQETPETDLVDSSPTRRTAKKRKVFSSLLCYEHHFGFVSLFSLASSLFIPEPTSLI